MATRRRALWLVSVGVAAAIFGATDAQPATAQPDCMSALGPDIPGVSINSGNNISIQLGPNNVNPGQSSSVGNNTSQNTGNVTSCCVNGRCCVSTDGGPATCTP